MARNGLRLGSGSNRTRARVQGVPPASAGAGVTLVQVLVVIVIVGILGAVAVLRLADLQAPRDEMAASTLMMHLRYAQSVALSRECTTRVKFSVASNRYSVAIADTNAPGGYVLLKDPVTRADWVTDLSAEFPGVALSTVDFNLQDALLFSATNGAPCDGSGAALTATGRIAFVSGRTLTVARETGYVALSP